MGVGGVDLAVAFIRHGLIDEYRLYVHPGVIGQGKPLVERTGVRVNLQLAKRIPSATASSRCGMT